MQDLCAGSYKMNAAEKNLKDFKKWKAIPCSWIRRLNIVKIAILSELIQHNPYQIPR